MSSASWASQSGWPYLWAGWRPVGGDRGLAATQVTMGVSVRGPLVLWWGSS